jgi:hypothetical protein
MDIVRATTNLLDDYIEDFLEINQPETRIA